MNQSNVFEIASVVQVGCKNHPNNVHYVMHYTMLSYATMLCYNRACFFCCFFFFALLHEYNNPMNKATE